MKINFFGKHVDSGRNVLEEALCLHSIHHANNQLILYWFIKFGN